MSAYIPYDMIIQIFSRLAPKSLLRFRCLSKSWKSLVSSPEFIWLHTQQTILSKPSTGQILRYFSINQTKEIYLIWKIDTSTGVQTNSRLGSPSKGKAGYYYRIVGICNGLLCLLDDLFGCENLLALWNPAVERCLTIPTPSRCYFNSASNMFIFGFGFAIKARDYKIVRMAYARGYDGYLVPPQVEVYALSSGIWKEFDGFIPNINVIEYFWTQAVVCGKVNWTAYKRTGGKRKVENLIMVFDLNDEIFQELSLPNILVNESPIKLNAAEYRELLAVYQYDARMWSSSCAIWVMKQYGVTESWSKQYNVELYPRGLGMVLGFRNNSEIMLTEGTGVLGSYNLETQENLRIGILGTKYSFYFGTYEESLVLLDKGEVLPPLDLSSSESDDDEDEDGENEAKKVPKLQEFWMHYSTHQRLAEFLEARNI